MRIPPLLLLLPILAGCSDEGDDWLPGRWAVDAQTCGVAWLTFNDDGSWTDRGLRGRWRLRGSALTLAHTHVSSGQSFNRNAPVTQVICHTEQVERVGADELRTRWEDGTVHRLVRCPTVEPPQKACLGDCEPVTGFEPQPWNLGPEAATRPCSAPL